MQHGFATSEGTERFAARYPGALANQFYRRAGALTVSSIGIGTYLGAMDEPTDRGYTESIRLALRSGINFIDTSLNYRHERSEKNIGAALAVELGAGAVARDEFVICTKAGFLVPGAVPTGKLADGDVVGGLHSMAPAFLEDQIERSLGNLGLDTVDVLYLHNPETQLQFLSEDAVYDRIRRAFRALESEAAAGRIVHYGVATWQAFREKAGTGQGLSLSRLVEIARQEGGERHRFRFVQFPFNLGMAEAHTGRWERVDDNLASPLEIAGRSGLTAVASATLLQARLVKDLPAQIAEFLPETSTDVQRAIQFTRSTPGLVVSLVGMSDPAHVTENLSVAEFPPLPAERYARFFE